ncbi:MAG TPA: recombinase family protein, partial [Jiangellales bacterium]|nr:recombinase family protein [Jiangellales bacterium]
RVAREGWAVVDVLVENDVGASSYSRKPRPIYASLVERARRREFDVILAYSNSRLTRRPLELEELIRLHEATGVRLATVVSRDDDLSTADGRMVARIKASIDAGEAERVSERTRRAKLQRARQGQPMTGGGRPFGYANDRLTVIDEEAAAIRDAAARVLAGESLVSIVAEWNRTGSPATVHGGLWTQRTLRGILRSPRIAGLSEHKGKVVGAAVWPAIIDRDAWERIRAEISAPGHGKHEHRLLSGLLRCACGSRMSPTGRAGLYRCAPVPGTGGCGRVARKYQPLEQWVVAQWAEHMTADRVGVLDPGGGPHRTRRRRGGGRGGGGDPADRHPAGPLGRRAGRGTPAVHVDSDVDRHSRASSPELAAYPGALRHRAEQGRRPGPHRGRCGRWRRQAHRPLGLAGCGRPGRGWRDRPAATVVCGSEVGGVMGPGGGFGMGWMWLWWLLLLVGVVVVVVGLTLAWRSGDRSRGAGTARGPSSAREVLDERFARGEIDEEEYRARRRVLDER